MGGREYKYQEVRMRRSASAMHPPAKERGLSTAARCAVWMRITYRGHMIRRRSHCPASHA